jgi:hypothetical protein
MAWIYEKRKSSLSILYLSKACAIRSEVSMDKRKTLSLLLIAIGLLLFCFVLIDIAPYGLVAGLVSGWGAAILICSGSFLLLNAHVRKSLLAVFMALIVWSLIFLVQLPGNLQILIAPAIGLISILVYKSFKTRKSRSHHF